MMMMTPMMFWLQQGMETQLIISTLITLSLQEATMMVMIIIADDDGSMVKMEIMMMQTLYAVEGNI